MGDIPTTHTSRGQQVGTFGFHLGQEPVDPRPVEGVEAAGEGAGEIEGNRCGEEADVAPPPRGNDQARRAERRRDAIAMHGSRATEGEDRQTPRIAAALQCVHPRRAGHHLVDDLVDPQAASSTLSPSGPATTRRMASRAASTSSDIAPPRKNPGSR